MAWRATLEYHAGINIDINIRSVLHSEITGKRSKMLTDSEKVFKNYFGFLNTPPHGGWGILGAIVQKKSHSKLYMQI